MNRNEKIEKFGKDAINKMLEIGGHEVRFDDVLEIPEWYKTYTWTTEQEQLFADWYVSETRKRFRWTVKLAKKELTWFMLMWGLYVENK